MQVVVSGSTGLIGSALVSTLSAGGHAVTRLVRSEPRAGQAEVHWAPAAGTIDHARLEGMDGVVHLAGENIAGRWTPAKKAQIRASRVQGTRLLANALTRLEKPPRVLISASAMGYYGDRGEEVLREDGPSGSGFLAEVCREWEAAAVLAEQKGIRVVCLRTGMVLSSAGGALARMLTPFKMGLGGKIGNGRQYMSWIALDDLVGIIVHALGTETLRGAANAASPNPVTNRDFTKTLGRVLRRPTLFPLPAFVARLAFGEMAQELLLYSIRLEPARILATGYQFRFPELERALHYLLRI